MAESKEKLKSFLMKMKEESEKVELKLNIQKMEIMASGPITSWQTDGKTMEIVADFIFLGSKSLQMMAAAMKLKDACSLEEKLYLHLDSMLKSILKKKRHYFAYNGL